MACQVFPFISLFFCLHFYIIHAHPFESRDNFSSPLDFLPQLRGVQKGNHQRGVNELKKHLSYLGYIDYDIYRPNESKNIFDDSLELTLKKYQEFYDLNITGVLDATTISNMQELRCGMPDFYNPKESVIPFHTTSHYAFFPGQSKWPKRTLKYAFNKNMKEEEKAPLEQAIREWASSTPFKFIRTSDLSQADIKMSFMPKYHGDGHPFVGPDAGLAHTFAPPDGRVHFDASQKWSSKVEKRAYDIQTVGLHELGHALGLGHSRIKKAVMYPIINLGQRKGLHDDDIKGIKALYKL